MYGTVKFATGSLVVDLVCCIIVITKFCSIAGLVLSLLFTASLNLCAVQNVAGMLLSHFEQSFQFDIFHSVLMLHGFLLMRFCLHNWYLSYTYCTNRSDS